MKDFAVYLRTVRHLDDQLAGDLTERFEHWQQSRDADHLDRWEHTLTTHRLASTRDELVTTATTFAHRYLTVFPTLNDLIYWTATASLAGDVDDTITTDHDAHILHHCWTGTP